MNITERQQNRIYDRAFDAACLMVKGEEEWAGQIMARLESTYPEMRDDIWNLHAFYVRLVTGNNSFLTRADYMIENRNSLKLQYK